VTEWPFTDSPNLAVITLRQVVREGHPILLVVHQRGWQFLTGTVGEPMLVSLAEIVDRDVSIVELADLRIGWHAWRERPGAAWVREPCGRGSAA
jgi:hypothetical protein